MKTNMRKFDFFLIISPLLFSFSCSEQKAPDRLHEILNSIENGDKIKIDELLEITDKMEGTATISLDSARFEITFPITNPIESTTTQIIDNGEIEIHHYTANMQDREDDNLAYNFDYLFLQDIETEEQINNLFDAQRDYITSAANATIEFEKIINLNGITGRHLYLTIDGSDIKTNYKMYFDNGIFYKLAVVTEKGKLFNKAISKFFDSFKILK